jgi:hypothetical protein
MTPRPSGDLMPSPRILMGPGPTIADPRVLRAMSTPLVGQFDPEFTRIMNEVMELCRFVFQTENAGTFPVSGSGRAALEAALVSLVQPGERVVVGECGRFGLLLIEIAERCGAEVVAVRAEWGDIISVEAIRAALASAPRTRLVQFVEEAEEREHVRLAVESLTRSTGSRPLGWYTGRLGPNTRRLVVEEGGFLYDADAYNDDLPYWVEVAGRSHLVVPYTLDNNDMKFSLAGGFNSGDQFFGYLRDAFDVLYGEAAATPRMMSVGLHARLVGRPGRFAALCRFLDHVQKHRDVWICRRIDIARHWIERHPPRP